MENINKHICCDVCSCANNNDGKNCKLNQVKITCDCADCTCCGSFTNKHE